MKQLAALLLSLGFLLPVPLPVQAQPTVDGQTTDDPYMRLGTSPPEPGESFTGGIVGLNAYAGPDSLYVAVEGKVRNNHSTPTREIVVFINSSAVNGLDSGTPLPAGNAPQSPFAFVDSMQMDMETDFGIRLTGDQENRWAFASFADYAGYVAGDSTDEGKVKDLFEKTLTSLDGTPEKGAATGGTYAYDDTSDINAVDGTGFEFALPHASLGTSESDEFQFFAVYGKMGKDTVSATLIPDDGETMLYGSSEDWTSVSGTQATGAQVLPVELTTFEAHRSGRTVVLTWKTASETNNAGFAVQHATGSGDFRRVGWVQGVGTTTEAHTYQFVHEDLSAGTHRFRLKQKDLDGTARLSKIVEIKTQLDGPIAIRGVAPNPVMGTSTLRFTMRESGEVTVALYDVLGRRVETAYQGYVSGGQLQQASIDATSLSSGVYFLRVRGEGFARTRRITVAQ